MATIAALTHPEGHKNTHMCLEGEHVDKKPYSILEVVSPFVHLAFFSVKKTHLGFFLMLKTLKHVLSPLSPQPYDQRERTRSPHLCRDKLLELLRKPWKPGLGFRV